jgi:hypothetical protein
MEEEASWLFYCDIDSSSRTSSTKTMEESSGGGSELISASTDTSEIEEAHEIEEAMEEEASWLFFYDADPPSRLNSTKTMDEASGGHGELISASTDTKSSEIEEANGMGAETAKLEETAEANEGTMMRAGQFLDMGSSAFLAKLYKLFSTTYKDDDTSEYTHCVPHLLRCFITSLSLTQ